MKKEKVSMEYFNPEDPTGSRARNFKVKHLFYFAIVLFIMVKFDIEGMLKFMYSIFSKFGFSESITDGLVNIATWITEVTMIGILLKSGYHIGVWAKFGTNNTGSSKTRNIEDVMSYRNGILGTMDNRDGASEYAQTAWVDGLTNDKSRNTDDVRGYINGNLGCMSNEDGYKWLKKGAPR